VDDAIITNRVPPDPKPVAQEEPTLPWGRTLVVETARDGFDAEVVRHVIPQDGTRPRDLDLKSSYEPARTVTLVGSAGKPASANLDDAIQKALDALKPKPTPAPSNPSATPATSATPGASPNAPAATAQPQPQPAPANATNATNGAANHPVGATPTATAHSQPAAPTPKPQPTTKPSGNAVAPTPTPNH
jgi:hypothetical protein